MDIRGDIAGSLKIFGRIGGHAFVDYLPFCVWRNEGMQMNK